MSRVALVVTRGRGRLEELCLLIGVHRRGGGAVLLAKLRSGLEGVGLDGRRRGASIAYAAVVGVVVLGAWHLRGGPWRLVVGLRVGSGRGMQHSDGGVWLDNGREYLSHLSVEEVRGEAVGVVGRQVVVEAAGTCGGGGGGGGRGQDGRQAGSRIDEGAMWQREQRTPLVS